MRYGFFAVLVLASEAAFTGYAFQPRTLKIFRTWSTDHAISASSYSEFEDGSRSSSSNAGSIRKAMDNVTNTYIESLSSAVKYEEDMDETEIALKRQRREEQVGGYRVTLPLAVGQPLGLTLSQVETGKRISQVELDLDTMKIHEPSGNPDSEAGRERMDRSAVEGRLEPSFRGLLVASVVQESPAWNSGIRPGDILTAVSATLGDSVWPKSTLEGVQSAISSRQVMSSLVALELQRISEQVRNQYELALRRPLGIEIQETKDGYVEVTGFSDNAPNLVKYAIQIGDRVLAVESTLGDQMWPVSTVEGVISACTSRLPGNPVRIRFERPEANMAKSGNMEIPKEAAKPAPAAITKAVVQQAPNEKELLSRCRDVLRRYAAEDNQESRFKGKYAVPAIVADKVVDAIASASASVDCVTLSMIMSAYLSCRQPESAIRVFEVAVGFNGDGSSNPATQKIEGKNGGAIVPSEAALNLYTASALLKAHALKGDVSSVLRVLAAVEGRSGVDVDGLESAPWPWTGTYGSIKPDTQCYNIALSAAEKVGGNEAVETALALFERMAEPTKKASSEESLVKDNVTYNTMISALSNAGRSDEAFNVFEQMQRSGLRPDKYTYTSLIKACYHDGDIQELLYDMKERGVQADVVTYNTMIRSLCDKRNWSQATRLVTEMESRGISPDSRTYGLLMNAMLKADKPSACLTLFESACANERTAALAENVHLYTTAITAASVLGDHERALELVSRMNANGIKANLKTLTAVMGACLSAGKPDIATQVYRRIEEPDGYAMSQGIRALCGSGDLSAASSILTKMNRRSRMMTGKQVMSSYKSVITAALEQKNYSVAKEMMSDLLKKGFVPNKAISFAMIDAMALDDIERAVFMDEEDGKPMFGFLLSIFDALQSRNLPVDGPLYAATLMLGSQLGGLPRKIASLMPTVRRREELRSREILSAETDNAESSVYGWEDLWLTYDSYKSELTPEHLPHLPVRISSREVRRILYAEQAVTYRQRRQRKRQIASTK